MNSNSYLYSAFKGLDEAMNGTLGEAKFENIKEAINNYAIASAIGGMAASIIPGVAGVAAMISQSGFVWATYIKINKTVGISMSEHTVKFLASAMMTNVATNAGLTLATYAAAAIISFIPLYGNAIAAAINAALGYMMVYVAAVLYLTLITKLIQPDGTIKVDENDDTKHIIKDIINECNLKDLIKEGRDSYKKIKADGALDRAKKNPKCPGCGADVRPGQKFCSDCGTALM